MKLKLIRVCENLGATRGVLLIDNEPQCLTLELPYKNNERNVSCVPDGIYKVTYNYSPKLQYNVYTLQVPDRSHVHVHIANLAVEIEGCIAVGNRYGSLGGKPAVLNSSKAFSDLMLALKGIKETQITIISAFGRGEAQ